MDNCKHDQLSSLTEKRTTFRKYYLTQKTGNNVFIHLLNSNFYLTLVLVCLCY